MVSGQSRVRPLFKRKNRRRAKEIEKHDQVGGNKKMSRGGTEPETREHAKKIIELEKKRRRGRVDFPIRQKNRKGRPFTMHDAGTTLLQSNLKGEGNFGGGRGQKKEEGRGGHI